MAVTIDAILKTLAERDASDLHLKSGKPPVMRIRGELVRVPEFSVTPEEHSAMLLAILNDERREKLENFKECDLSYSLEGVARFRVNMFWQRGDLGAVFRVIPHRIKTIDQL